MNAKLATLNLRRAVAPLKRYAYARRISASMAYDARLNPPYLRGARAVVRMREVRLLMTRLETR